MPAGVAQSIVGDFLVVRIVSVRVVMRPCESVAVNVTVVSPVVLGVQANVPVALLAAVAVKLASLGPVVTVSVTTSPESGSDAATSMDIGSPGVAGRSAPARRGGGSPIRAALGCRLPPAALSSPLISFSGAPLLAAGAPARRRPA